ncbi:putative aminophospholipid-translocase [Coemansia spiralis]|nr:putative aminophospholipid-translocase [Coemansia spiralis]
MAAAAAVGPAAGGRAGAARTEPLNPADRRAKRSRYPANVVSNNKYNAVTFLPLVLFEQFKFFFNLYFLLVPQLQIGYLVTYVGPLVFVLLVTMGKELHDDIGRRRRDTEANSQRYQRLAAGGDLQVVASAKLAVGDLVVLEKNQCVPADMVLLRTTESSGACFVRTDQLDGETDWKLRVAVPFTHRPRVGDWRVTLRRLAGLAAAPPHGAPGQAGRPVPLHKAQGGSNVAQAQPRVALCPPDVLLASRCAHRHNCTVYIDAPGRTRRL